MNTSRRYGNCDFEAELYDFIPGHNDLRDLEFYLDLCRATDGSILELGCGTGRILIPAASSGCPIVGLDFSPYMLARCRQKLQSQSQEVQERARLVQGNMTDFDLNESFSLVIIPFRTLHLLASVDDQMACLQSVSRHLREGGRLAFDIFQVDPRKTYGPTFTEEEYEESSGVDLVDLPDGRKFRRTHRRAAHHWAQQYNDIELIYYVTHPDGRTEKVVEAFPLRFFFRYEVEHLLARCGYRIAELFGDFDKSPLMDNSPEMIFIAEKCRNAV